MSLSTLSYAFMRRQHREKDEAEGEWARREEKRRKEFPPREQQEAATAALATMMQWMKN